MGEGVCGVIVTYGDRGPLLESAVKALTCQTVSLRRLVVVDNGSVEGVAVRMARFSERFPIEIVRNERNLGSAAGFKAGMQRAASSDCGLLWLLDDDNSPEPDALERLLAARTCAGNEEGDLFASLRTDRHTHREAASLGLEISAPRPNSFLQFTLGGAIGRSVKRLLARPRAERPVPLTRMGYAIYGGLLLPKAWLKRVGYPDERYFSYLDDTEFTTRIVRAGGRIHLVAMSRIADLEPSWHVALGSQIPALIHPNAEDSKLYYTVRNSAFFEMTQLVDSNLRYSVNVAVFLFILAARGIWHTRSPGGVWKRLRLIWKAFEDGRKGRMGYEGSAALQDA